MTLDPSIPLSGQSPKFNDPFAVLSQYRQQAQEREYVNQQMRSAQALEEQRRQEAQQKQQEAERRAASEKALADAFRQAIDPATKKVDPDRLSGILTELGFGAAAPEVVKGLHDSNAAALKAKEAKTAAEKAELDYARTLGQHIVASDFSPAVIDWTLTHAETEGHDVSMLRQLQQQPDQFKNFVTRLVTPEKTAPIAVPHGTVLIDPTTHQPVFSNNTPDPPKPGSKEDVLARFAREKGKKIEDLTTKDIADAEKQSSVAPAGVFQSKDLINPKTGKPGVANFDPRTGGYTFTDLEPVPTDTQLGKQQGKQTIGNVMDAISELSEKINTGRGVMATAQGKEKRAAAEVNLNDDVAEYQALISGFTPIIARAVGHTGVLTQQDVDSVRAMFPKPEDSKSLRDRKITRVKSLLMQGAASASPAAAPAGGSVTVTAGGKTYTFPNQAAADAFKKASGGH